MKNNILTFIFSLIVVSGNSATYFVDYGSGSDASAGTSTGTAWQHMPGDVRASGSANITLSPGDTLVFQGGVTYTFPTNAIELNSHEVTLISGHVYSSQWGTTRAVFDLSNCSPTNSAVDGCLYLGSKSNVVVNGIYFTGGGYQDSYSAQLGWRQSAVQDANLYITDCVFSNHVESAMYIVGRFDAGEFARNFTVTNCTFKEIGTHGVFFRYGLTNCLVVSNTFNRIGTRSDSPGPGGDPVAVFGNDSPSIHSGLVVKGNDMSDVPIKSYVILSDQNENTLIEGNYFHGTNGYSGFDFNGSGTNIIARNNLFDMRVANFYSPFVLDTDQGSGIVVDGFKAYNNTIRAATANIGLVFLGKGNSGSAQTSRNVDIRNNVFISTTASRSMIYIETSATGAPATEMATFTCDYNTFETNSYATAFHLQGTNFSFAGWQALGHDAHSYGGTPTFTGSEYALDASDTLAKDAGVDLSGSGVTTDRLGSPRPQGAAFDIGAFEFFVSPLISTNAARGPGFSGF